MKQKLIDQLIHRAGARFGGDGINYDGFVPSKFAELIVKECMSFQDEAGVYSKFDMADAIAQHFGVSTHPLRRVTA